MAFLYCETCGWEQDDFYDMDGYNPSKSLSSWNDSLCGERSDKIDELFSKDSQFLREFGPISTREIIAKEYAKYARRILEMKWITREQWDRDKDTAICPKCGDRNFNID